MTRFLFQSFVLTAFLSACAAPTRIATTTPATVLSPAEIRVMDLLDQARAAFEDNRLTTPFEDNAYFRYLQVLSLDADNMEAAEGINAIVEQYLSWAMEATRRGNSKGALKFVGKAKSIDSEHPNIQPVLAMIRQARSKHTTIYDLDRTAVADKREDRIAFHAIAKQIAEDGAFVTIRAADDESGRWLYQQLNRRSKGRIEASFEKDPNPSISLTR